MELVRFLFQDTSPRPFLHRTLPLCFPPLSLLRARRCNYQSRSASTSASPTPPGASRGFLRVVILRRGSSQSAQFFIWRSSRGDYPPSRDGQGKGASARGGSGRPRKEAAAGTGTLTLSRLSRSDSLVSASASVLSPFLPLPRSKAGLAGAAKAPPARRPRVAPLLLKRPLSEVQQCLLSSSRGPLVQAPSEGRAPLTSRVARRSRGFGTARSCSAEPPRGKIAKPPRGPDGREEGPRECAWRPRCGPSQRAVPLARGREGSVVAAAASSPPRPGGGQEEEPARASQPAARSKNPH